MRLKFQVLTTVEMLLLLWVITPYPEGGAVVSVPASPHGVTAQSFDRNHLYRIFSGRHLVLNSCDIN
jgi:hypothetical protein